MFDDGDDEEPFYLNIDNVLTNTPKEDKIIILVTSMPESGMAWDSGVAQFGRKE